MRWSVFASVLLVMPAFTYAAGDRVEGESEALRAGIKVHDFLASAVNRGLWNQAGESSTAGNREAEAAAIPSKGDPPGGLLQVVLMPVDAVSSLTADSDVKVPCNFLYVRFSKPFLERYFCRQVDRTNAVNDNILGVAVSGTSHTVGATHLELADNSSQAQMTLRLAGNTKFDTIGDSRPVEIFTRGTTNFTAAEELSFDGLRLVHHDEGCKANTQSTVTGMSTSLRFILGRISLRIASRREAASHELAESITAARTRERVEHGFDSAVEKRTVAFTDLLKSRYARLPLEGDYKLSEIRCSTSPTTLQIVVLGQGSETPRFVSAPEPIEGNPEIELHIHTALLQKASTDSALRATMENAINQLFSQPLNTLVAATRPIMKAGAEPPQFHWREGANADWLSISWKTGPGPN